MFFYFFLVGLLGSLLDEQEKSQCQQPHPKSQGWGQWVRSLDLTYLYSNLVSFYYSKWKNPTSPLWTHTKKNLPPHEDWKEKWTWFLFASLAGFIIKWKQLADQSHLFLFLLKILTLGWALGDRQPSCPMQKSEMAAHLMQSGSNTALDRAVRASPMPGKSRSETQV